MNIMIMARGYPTEKYKLNGIFEFDQAKALAKSGCKVVYAAIDVRSIRRWRKWGIEYKSIDGVKVYAINIPGGRIPKYMLQWLSEFGLKVLYKKILNEHGIPNILHAHFTDLGYLAVKLKKETHIPLVVTEHSSAINKKDIDKKLFNIAKITYSNADAIIAVSHSLGNIIKKQFNIDTMYVPNMVDTEVFCYSPREKSNKFNFVSTGNLINLKRMDLTIEAFHRAFKNKENITLTIFGEGPERQNLEKLIENYKLSSRVKLMGLCSRNNIAKQYINTDCFVLASQSETFGVAYIEALASGVPVIATKCGGPEGFVNEENGILVPINDINYLEDAMKCIYNNRLSYDREKISLDIIKKFSPESISKKLIKIYTEIIQISMKESGID